MKRTLYAHGLCRKIMKLSFMQLFLAVVFVGISYANDTHAQELLEKRISLRIQDQSVKAILSKIETEANVKFMYSPKAIQSQGVLLYKSTISRYKKCCCCCLNP